MKPVTRYLKYSLIATAALVVPALAAGPIVISQKGRTFSPKSIVVKKGETVRFLNDDEYVHHAYIKSSGFNYDAGEIETEKFSEVQMNVPGSFEVRCAIHPKMRLVVDVK